ETAPASPGACCIRPPELRRASCTTSSGRASFRMGLNGNMLPDRSVMKPRIAAGVLLEHEGKVLLVHHRKAGAYDFWVAPGGGAEGVEDLRATARREAFEECGLHVEPGVIAYIEEFSNPHTRECKVWF